MLRDLEVPLTAVPSVDVLPDGLRAAVGIRAPGLGVPGVRNRHQAPRGRRTVVAVRRKRPALRIVPDDTAYVALPVELADPAMIAAAISTER